MSTLSLKDQIVLITGANAGIGKACAVVMAQAGATIVVNHRPKESSAHAAQDVVSTIEAAGGQACALAADVSDEDQVVALFEQIAKRYGRLDTLVSNAGIEQPAAIEEMTLAKWRAVLDVNLTGQFLCAREAVRLFRRNTGGAREAQIDQTQAGREQTDVSAHPVAARSGQPARQTAIGRIIMMSSVHEVIPWAFQNNYAASKGGVAMFMRSLAQEVAPDRIRVNSIAPGAIRTDINREAWEGEEALAELLKLIPYGRIGEPEDVARAAVWLASDESDYVTGTSLFVDGGMTLYPAFRGNG